MSTRKKIAKKKAKKKMVKKLTRLQQWNKQMANLKRLMSELEEMHLGQGRDWIEGMKRHYTARIDMLNEHKPKPAKR